MTNDSVVEWVTNVHESEYHQIDRYDKLGYTLGSPKATDTFSVPQLNAQGFIGVWKDVAEGGLFLSSKDFEI